ncbi:HNH endonuclease [Bacillus sp. S14(2024)]|uniref:HNH endonuclease n=1 Tax=Bacillus sp. S14(2024) TaxID=3162884 RepID=UPI003D1F24C9
MLVPNENQYDALKFAAVLLETQLENNEIKLGNFVLTGKKGIKSTVQYNKQDFQILRRSHEYTFPLLDGELELSLQLYENTSSHYRLFCYSKCNNISGMLFSINLTTEKDAKGSIFLTQKIKFSDRLSGNEEYKKQFRRMKQRVFVNMLRKLNFEVTDTNDLLLGIFDTKRCCFLNTTSAKFLEDFILVSMLKGHFMGNKGYELEIMPSYNNVTDMFNSYDKKIEVNLLPHKVSAAQKSRNISLSLRYKVLDRDNGKCKLCGRTPSDGVKLHVDHIIPYSLGGLTILDNLQTLCDDCNIGKSNKSTKKF